MSCWHDPRGRLVVDGEGRTVRRETDADRKENIAMWPTTWEHCRRCVAVFPARSSPRYYAAPHSCRPERHR